MVTTGLSLLATFLPDVRTCSKRTRRCVVTLRDLWYDGCGCGLETSGGGGGGGGGGAPQVSVWGAGGGDLLNTALLLRCAFLLMTSCWVAILLVGGAICLVGVAFFLGALLAVFRMGLFLSTCFSESRTAWGGLFFIGMSSLVTKGQHTMLNQHLCLRVLNFAKLAICLIFAKNCTSEYQFWKNP